LARQRPVLIPFDDRKYGGLSDSIVFSNLSIKEHRLQLTQKAFENSLWPFKFRRAIFQKITVG